MEGSLKHYIDGKWLESRSGVYHDVYNPALGRIIGRTPAAHPDEVEQAAQAAFRAAQGWGEIPAGQRIQYLFRMKRILENHADEVARICTGECGKTLAESRGEIIRALENIEVACGIPALMQGDFSEEIATGVDEFLIRQPLGPTACITPFNFPVMIPFWFLPYALACGNTCIVKPSEKTPMSMTRIFELLEELRLPPGVLNLLQGGRETAEALIDHSLIPAISFVGSSSAARRVYQRAAARGKRVQAQGGAKNAVVVMADADRETTIRIIADSAFGCAGQRCLAASLVYPVGDAAEWLVPGLVEEARTRTLGDGTDGRTAVGPLISQESRQRIEGMIGNALAEGAEILLDGRGARVEGREEGYFLGPTILTSIRPESTIHRTELFGPVLGILPVPTLESAIALINGAAYGNAASLFTRSGSAARMFRHLAQAGNIGINIGIAAPIAYFPFSGWKESFFGDLHAQSRHSVEFFTQTKIVMERWHEEWTRKF